MTDTATPFEGPVDAPASADSIAMEIAHGIDTGSDGPQDAQSVADEMVKYAEGTGQAEEAPETEDDATEPAEGEEPEAEAETEETQPDETLVTVKVNGEERQVPLAEAIAGYSRTEDYKAKTAAVAQERRELEAKAASIDTDLKAEYANQLEQATKAFAEFDPVLMEARQIDWAALKATNPEGFIAAQDQVQARYAQLEKMQQQVATARQQADQQRQTLEAQQRAQRFDATADAIMKANPDLADEAKFQEFAGANIDYMKAVGFSDAEVADYLDHRVLTVMDKARRWDAHEAAQKSLPEKKVVQKSAVRPLTSDGGSRAPKPRFPANADRDRKGNWIAEQIAADMAG